MEGQFFGESFDDKALLSLIKNSIANQADRSTEDLKEEFEATKNQRLLEHVINGTVATLVSRIELEGLGTLDIEMDPRYSSEGASTDLMAFIEPVGSKKGLSYWAAQNADGISNILNETYGFHSEVTKNPIDGTVEIKLSDSTTVSVGYVSIDEERKYVDDEDLGIRSIQLKGEIASENDDEILRGIADFREDLRGFLFALYDQMGVDYPSLLNY